jgi:type IV pilus assembly protein PilB
MSIPLRELLLSSGKINKEQLDIALEKQKKTGKEIGVILVEEGIISGDELEFFLQKQASFEFMDLGKSELYSFLQADTSEFVDLKKITIEDNIINLIPVGVAKKYKLIPVAEENGKIKVVMSDPTNIVALEDIKQIIGKEIIPLIASENSIAEAIDKYYKKSKERDVLQFKQKTMNLDLDKEIKEIDVIEAPTDIEREEEIAGEKKAGEAPIIRFANKIIQGAVERDASDIHLEPYEKLFRIRYRIDGILYTVMEPPKAIFPALSSRFKIMSKLNIAEKRLPQDGRIKLKVSGKDIDFRVSTVPTIFGEKVVLRILDRANVTGLDLEDLGFEEEDIKKVKKVIEAPYGVILVTGPTGSGKTTTLYTVLDKINKEGVNILTVEDPIEYNIEGINQVQIKEEIGLTFPRILRSFLRQDPDIIMIGEIRDGETAEIATKAALTGHLVLSTLHTNDAISTIARLIDMKIEPYLIASTLILALAQRLVRKICSYCKKEAEVPPETLRKLGLDEKTKVYKGEGCSYCNNIGYKGRTSLFEVIPITGMIKQMILKGENLEEMRKEVIKEGNSTLRENGIKKVKEGITTVEEVLRVTMDVEK